MVERLRTRIRRHPLLTASLGALIGFVGAPLALRAGRRLFGVASALKTLTPTGAPQIFGVLRSEIKRTGATP